MQLIHIYIESVYLSIFISYKKCLIYIFFFSSVQKNHWCAIGNYPLHFGTVRINRRNWRPEVTLTTHVTHTSRPHGTHSKITGPTDSHPTVIPTSGGRSRTPRSTPLENSDPPISRWCFQEVTTQDNLNMTLQKTWNLLRGQVVITDCPG